MRKLTPLESELRNELDGALERTPRRGPWARYRAWRRERRPPRTLAQAIARGVVRLSLLVGAGGALAWLVARWLDRDLAIGLYVVGAAVVAIAVSSSMSTANRTSPLFDETSDREFREYTMRTSLAYLLVGLLLLVLGAVAESL
jgi:hypothetical protein